MAPKSHFSRKTSFGTPPNYDSTPWLSAILVLVIDQKVQGLALATTDPIYIIYNIHTYLNWNSLITLIMSFVSTQQDIHRCLDYEYGIVLCINIHVEQPFSFLIE